jgi:hypothetical protein
VYYLDVNKFLTILTMTERKWFKHRFALIYAIVSFVLFEKVYDTSKLMIDELFHIGQGLDYCHG